MTLDGSGHGAADPAAMAVSTDGRLVLIACAGAHQVLVIDRSLGARTVADLLPLGDSQLIDTVEVGQGPVAVTIDPSGRFAVTADAMSDTLTVFGLEDLSVEATVRVGPVAPRLSPEQRGERLFHDGRRSLDRWISCASCHTGGHTNGLNFDTDGDGNSGAPKNVPSLLGVGPTAPFAWTGGFRTLEDQVEKSLRTSLHGPRSDPREIADLAAYLKGLSPAPPHRDADEPIVRRGAEVFQTRNCQQCHVPPTYTSRPLRDVGLDDGPGGHRRFNPPSLLGVSRSAPYLHDGRARTLGDVLDVHQAETTLGPMSAEDREALIAFLESL